MAALSNADLRLKLSEAESQKRIVKAQRRLLALRLQLGGQIGDARLGPPICVLFEGWDASGKGGTIRRLVSPLDPRHVRVMQFGPPTIDERRHHFLHRFSAALPGWGGMAVLDRSWYGRVLVERVETLATESEWRRAYSQIEQWEAGLAAEGLVLVKVWLHISEAEQLRRFRARERDPLKRWKLTGEDWRNLSHRAGYEEAVAEMLATTDHPAARWHVIPAESKHYARPIVLELVVAAIEDALRAAGQTPATTGAAL
jgi:polyphosphate kinase 2 (PPK2 family)